MPLQPEYVYCKWLAVSTFLYSLEWCPHSRGGCGLANSKACVICVEVRKAWLVILEALSVVINRLIVTIIDYSQNQ